MAPTVDSNATNGKAKTRAYVTFLAGDGDYWKGVVALAKGLRKVKSVYPLVVAILPDVPMDHRRKLISQGCIIREIEPLYPPENQTSLPWPIMLLITPSSVFGSKMIYLDGDIQVFDNIDHLFDLPDGHFYAVMDCFCERNWRNSPQYQIGYCQQAPEKVHWPDNQLGPKPSLYFNAGMFVFEPNLSTYNNLLSSVKITQPTLFAEQDFLNMFFKDVYKPIPTEYNLILAMLWRHPENVDVKKVKVVHYCADGSKPWRYTGKDVNMDREDIKMLVNMWWEIYNDETLDYWKSCGQSMGTQLTAVDEPTLAVTRSGSRCFSAPSAA
ncbi:putative inositol 3-alpha-galactosyltransferase [Helianthus debilis subsp. tardiflorus]